MSLLRGAAAVLPLVLGLPAAASPPPLPTLWVWPGDVCSATLQECIDGTAPGDIVLVATDGPIDESLTITGSLELAAGGGFHPVFSASHFVLAQTAPSGDQRISVHGLAFQGGYVRVIQASTGRLTAEVRDNQITTDVSTSPGIWIEGTGDGPIDADVSGNLLVVAADYTEQQMGIAVVASPTTTSMHVAIDHNAISMSAGSEARAIALFGGDDSAFDVIANQIHGVAYNAGIDVSQSGSGAMAVRILDNLVTGQVSRSGVSGAIVLFADAGSLDATLVNNTFPYDGVGLATRIDAPASASVLVANNIFSGNSGGAMSIHGLVDGATLSQHHNLFFDNGADIAANPPITPGPHSVFASPHYAAASNYRLLDPSPAADAGDDAAAPADLLTDLAGNARVARAHVDIGAYEVPEPDAALAAVAAVLCLARRSRRMAGYGTVPV